MTWRWFPCFLTRGYSREYLCKQYCVQCDGLRTSASFSPHKHHRRRRGRPPSLELPCRSRPARVASATRRPPLPPARPLRIECVASSRLPLVLAVVDEVRTAVAVRAERVRVVVARMCVEAVADAPFVEVAVTRRGDFPLFAPPAGVRPEVELVVDVVVSGLPVGTQSRSVACSAATSRCSTRRLQWVRTSAIGTPTAAAAAAHRLWNLSRTCTVLVEVSKLAQASGERSVTSIRSFGRCRVQRRLRRTTLRGAVADPEDRPEGSVRACPRS